MLLSRPLSSSTQSSPRALHQPLRPAGSAHDILMDPMHRPSPSCSPSSPSSVWGTQLTTTVSSFANDAARPFVLIVIYFLCTVHLSTYIFPFHQLELGTRSAECWHIRTPQEPRSLDPLDTVGRMCCTVTQIHLDLPHFIFPRAIPPTNPMNCDRRSAPV